MQRYDHHIMTFTAKSEYQLSSTIHEAQRVIREWENIGWELVSFAITKNWGGVDKWVPEVVVCLKRFRCMEYEYMTIERVVSRSDEFLLKASQHGQEGWELVSVNCLETTGIINKRHHMKAFFKRPVLPKKNPWKTS